MAICTKCERIEEHYHTEDLSAEECYALAFAQAFAAGKDSKVMESFMLGEGRLARQYSEADRKRMRARGLKALADRGIVRLERNGLGEYDPVHYDGSKLVGGNVIVGDFS